jgi:hypothetical protein
LDHENMNPVPKEGQIDENPESSVNIEKLPNA